MEQMLRLPLELIVIIFSYLPQKDLLLLQRTCREWRSVISTSPALQERLFFRPRQENLDELNEDEVNEYDKGEFNSLLWERFPDFFNSRMDMDHLGPWRNTHWFKTVETQLLKVPDPEAEDSETDEKIPRKRLFSRHMLNQNYFTQRFPKLDPSALSSSPYRYPEASWRRMILCQPAPTEYQFTFHYSTRAGNREWRFRSVTNDHTVSGTQPYLTFGCLNDIIEQMWFHQKYFPIAHDVRIDYGPLTTIAEYKGRCQKPPLWITDESREEHTEEEEEEEEEVNDADHFRDSTYIHHMFIRQRRESFPQIKFHRPGCVLIDMSLTYGCGSYKPHPESFETATNEFHTENLPPPEFDIVLPEQEPETD